MSTKNRKKALRRHKVLARRREPASGPSIPKAYEWKDSYRLIPEQPIFLSTRVFCDWRYVARVFRATWERIPSSGRRKILKQVRRNRVLYVEVQWLYDNFGECYIGGDGIRLSKLLVNRFAERQLRHVIAHELGHVVDEGELHDWAESRLREESSYGEIVDLVLIRKELEPVDVCERRVNDLIATWGFPAPPTNGYRWTKPDRLRIIRNIEIGERRRARNQPKPRG